MGLNKAGRRGANKSLPAKDQLLMYSNFRGKKTVFLVSHLTMHTQDRTVYIDSDEDDLPTEITNVPLL